MMAWIVCKSENGRHFYGREYRTSEEAWRAAKRWAKDAPEGKGRSAGIEEIDHNTRRRQREGYGQR